MNTAEALDDPWRCDCCDALMPDELRPEAESGLYVRCPNCGWPADPPHVVIEDANDEGN